MLGVVQSSRRVQCCARFAGSLLLAVCHVALAQQSNATPTSLQQVVVTAERRSEPLQQAPLSMEAITGATLENIGAKDFADYATGIPNLALGIGSGAGGSGSGFGVSSARSVTIRGVAGNDTTGFYLNDTPIPLSLDPRVLDIERVEVLRGPQGTLFGAGSMGGTVRVITRTTQLDRTSGKVDLDGEAVEHGGSGYSAAGTVNAPLVPDALALRVSAFSAFDPGYFTRQWGIATVPGIPLPPDAPSGSRPHVGALHSTGTMASLYIAFPGMPGLTFTPFFTYQRSVSNGFPLADFTPDNLAQSRPLDVPEGYADTWNLASLTSKYESRMGKLVGSISYFYRDGFDDEDATDWAADVFVLPQYVAAPSLTHLYTKTWTGEARFESTFSGPVQTVVGAYVETTDRRYTQLVNTRGANNLAGGALGSDLLFMENSPNTDRQRAAFIVSATM